MSIKYGSLEHELPQKGKKSAKKDEMEVKDEQLTPDALEKHLGRLAYQKRAPSVAVRAATELLERKAGRGFTYRERLKRLSGTSGREFYRFAGGYFDLSAKNPPAQAQD